MTEQERISNRMPEIAELIGKIGVDIKSVSFIPGGKTNESYVVHGSDDKRYLARIVGEGTERFIDRNKEMYNVSAAHKLGVAPRLYCTDNNNLLLEYIEGACTTNPNILLFNDNMHKITEQLRILHESKELFQGKLSLIQDFETYKKNFLSTGHSIPSEMKQSEEELYAMTKWVDECLNKDTCSIHSDIVMQNIIFTADRAYIIDWEYSTVYDRYLELASFCTQNNLAPGFERLFLNSYFAGTKLVLDYEKFLLFKMAISFRWIYWHLNNVAHNKDTEYNECRWRMHLNNALMCKGEWEQRRREPSSSAIFLLDNEETC